MYRTLCVLALLTLQAGLAHCFSWDIVAAAKNLLEFYNEKNLTHSVTLTDVDVNWITYDPFHNRVLLMNTTKSLLSFDIATEKIQTLINLKFVAERSTEDRYAYDPATGLFFTIVDPYVSNMYSYLVKPGSYDAVDTNFVIELGLSQGLAVDSCGGYIYWITMGLNAIERAKFNGSEREEVIRSSDRWRSALTIDSQTQNMYWMEYGYDSKQRFIVSADLNGKHRRTLFHRRGRSDPLTTLTVSKDFIYWMNEDFRSPSFLKFPKNLPLGTDVEPQLIEFKSTSTRNNYKMAANYAIEEQPQGIPLCKALKSLLPNDSETNDSDSVNVSTDGSLFRVNETKVSGESPVSGDNVPVCQYYCLQGNCSVSGEGQPKCRCNAGYSGVRCEVHACQAYCLHDGVCSLSEQNNPVCQCKGDYQGERCDVPEFLIKCSQTVSLLKDILNSDLTSVTEGKGVKSTCASTVV